MEAKDFIFAQNGHADSMSDPSQALGKEVDPLCGVRCAVWFRFVRCDAMRLSRLRGDAEQWAL